VEQSAQVNVIEATEDYNRLPLSSPTVDRVAGGLIESLADLTIQ
jgi:hypothetical protein